ncbi:hypothetical protein GCM10007933_03700 [Zoogloea oryzae]|uniref:DUF932 domain-containing protein n=1 Tax=Zoogloea oryzae TaxID=310767 RepID=A0ABQ6F5V8_9RHOO|nr:hypothetical protein [Zoogloea oryzae]GLT20918.1 hypothetical protein GCM10007933_03700 [Zoogloea oryzae]
MKKLPRLPEYPTLDEVAAWLTGASDEAWSPSAVLSRLLEWDRPEILPDGTVRQSRVATSREVWVVVPPGEAMTAQVDGAEVVTRGGLLAYILEPIDLFVSTVWHCGEAVALNGVSTQAGERFHVTRRFSVHDIRIPRNDAFQLLSAFDQLVLELDRGEHPDLARRVDEVRPVSEGRGLIRAIQPELPTAVAVEVELLGEEGELAGLPDDGTRDASLLVRPASTPRKSKPDALDHAIDVGLIAYEKHHGVKPSIRALFDWLATRDETKTIVEYNEDRDVLTWRRADMGLSDTGFKAFQNRKPTARSRQGKSRVSPG